jgi:hypothetical protein
MRIGRKIGKSFVSFGKSGTYVSTWIGGWRLSNFSPAKRNKKETKTEHVDYSGLDLTNTFIGDCIIGLFLGIISYLLVVWLVGSILTGIASIFVVYWIWWLITVYRYRDEPWGDIALMFFAPLFTFFTIPGIIGWIILLTLGIII